MVTTSIPPSLQKRPELIPSGSGLPRPLFHMCRFQQLNPILFPIICCRYSCLISLPAYSGQYPKSQDLQPLSQYACLLMP